MLVNIGLQFLKWRVVCNSVLKIDDNQLIWKSLVIGFAAGLVTPIRVGEYFGRKLALGNIPLVKVSISTLLEKFTSLYMILLVGAIIAAIFMHDYYSIYFSFPLILFALVLLVLIPLTLKVHGKSNSIIKKYESKISLVKQIGTEIEYIKKMQTSEVSNLLFFSFLFYLVIILQYVSLAFAFEPNGNLINFTMAAILILFIKSILSFLSFADLGIRESSSVFLLNKMGYAEVVGFNSAIFLFLFNLLIPSLIGLFYLIKTDFNKHNVEEPSK